MAQSADDPYLDWIEPKERGILPLEAFHVPRRLARFVRNTPYQVVADHDFSAVIAACAAPRAKEGQTWINAPIRELYGDLFRRGFCHTIEVYDGNTLVGGLYGVSIGAAFFGESMFHRARDASKLALVHLVARLRAGGYKLLDAQFLTEHLGQFGAIAVPRLRYKALLAQALAEQATFSPWPAQPDGRHLLAHYLPR